MDSAMNILHLSHQTGRDDRMLVDPVVLLPNRERFVAMLDSRRENSSPRNRGSALIVVDFDDFRDIVERFGYETGNEVLRIAAGKISETLRHSDFAARIEADEFHLYIDDLLSREAVLSFGQRLKNSLKGVWSVKGNDLFVSVSTGIVYVEKQQRIPDDLLRKGTVALRKAKDLGKGNIYLYEDGIDAAQYRRYDLETSLHQALERNELYLCYQPIVEARTGKLAGLEALIRWNSAKYGEVTPTEFIPVAEDSGLIIPIGNWVIETICAQRRQWDLDGYGNFFIAANISPVQLQQDDFTTFVTGVIDRYGVSRSSIEFEVTESSSPQSMAKALEFLRHIRNRGIAVSLDDFGTGYSSLARLKNMPIDSLKIDKSFVDDIGINPFSEAIISGIVHLAGRAHLRVIAEGIESAGQADYLTEAGCDCLQGYLFSKPVRGEELGTLLRDERVSFQRDCYYYQI